MDSFFSVIKSLTPPEGMHQTHLHTHLFQIRLQR